MNWGLAGEALIKTRLEIVTLIVPFRESKVESKLLDDLWSALNDEVASRADGFVWLATTFSGPPIMLMRGLQHVGLYLFTHKLCHWQQSECVTLTPDRWTCWQRFFVDVNNVHHNSIFVGPHDSIALTNLNKVAGLDTLWRIALAAPSPVPPPTTPKPGFLL